MKEKYKLTVGLEIHAELSTKTKMFCNSINNADEASPNVNICPVCMGYPGTLPVINKEAVRSVLRMGAAINGEIADYTEFNRKNYFYPDIPKGYQISQYKFPLVKGGELAGVKITRVHLEEDTAKSIHGENGESLLNFNRAGAPLMELVTEPVIHDPVTASRFAKELQLLLTYLGIAHANMEKGEMRVEANISISNTDNLGVKVEVKNLNSFRSVEKAIDFEFSRQAKLLENGESIVQETRGWDENRGETFSQRVKEDSHDYRYFSDPDLPKLFINSLNEFSLANLKTSLPELPNEKRIRLSKFGIPLEHVEIYVTQATLGNYFEEVAAELGNARLIKLASNYLTSELKELVDVLQFCESIRMIDAGELSSKGAKALLRLLVDGGTARDAAQKNELLQISDEKILNSFVDEVLAEEDNNAPAQYLVGQTIKKSKGRGNPVLITKIIQNKLKNEE